MWELAIIRFEMTDFWAQPKLEVYLRTHLTSSESPASRMGPSTQKYPSVRSSGGPSAPVRSTAASPPPIVVPPSFLPSFLPYFLRVSKWPPPVPLCPSAAAAAAVHFPLQIRLIWHGRRTGGRAAVSPRAAFKAQSAAVIVVTEGRRERGERR